MIILFAFEMLLCVAVWQAFLKDDKVASIQNNEEESRLVSILEQIDGVGEAQVMIGKSENGERGVVIVCDGANQLSVIMNIREAAAVALGIEKNNVKIYLKNQ